MCSQILPVHIDQRHAAQLSRTGVRSTSQGDLQLREVVRAEHVHERSSGDARRGEPATLQVGLQVSGRSLLVQDDELRRSDHEIVALTAVRSTRPAASPAWSPGSCRTWPGRPRDPSSGPPCAFALSSEDAPASVRHGELAPEPVPGAPCPTGVTRTLSVALRARGRAPATQQPGRAPDLYEQDDAR